MWVNLAAQFGAILTAVQYIQGPNVVIALGWKGANLCRRVLFSGYRKKNATGC